MGSSSTHASGRILARHGFDLDRLGERPEVAGPRGPLPWAEPIPLPFLWVHGRRDATISVMGANIYPEDVEAVLYRDPEVATRLHSFLLSVVDDEAGTPRPLIALELTETSAASTRRGGWPGRSPSRSGSAQLNMDFRSSVGEFPAAMRPTRPDLRPSARGHSRPTPTASSSGASRPVRPARSADREVVQR